MIDIFINLKRFDVPRRMGGICQKEDPQEWVEWIIEESVASGLGKRAGVDLVYLLPEALLLPAMKKCRSYPEAEVKNIKIGSQGVFREDVTPGRNFGAFTTNLPAAAVVNMGCAWSIIGHSEERKDKLGMIKQFTGAFEKESGAADGGQRKDSASASPAENRSQVLRTVHALINEEVLRALKAGLHVLLCVGESAEEKGEGSFEEQKPRIKEALEEQLRIGLVGVSDYLSTRRLVIGYEPIWAIGPGKTPPGGEYIDFVSSYIKETVKELYGFGPVVVYGGGLKEENAGMLAKVPSIGGGLVALTRFTGEIGFEPEGLKRIIEKYLENA